MSAVERARERATGEEDIVVTGWGGNDAESIFIVVTLSSRSAPCPSFSLSYSLV